TPRAPRPAPARRRGRRAGAAGEPRRRAGARRARGQDTRGLPARGGGPLRTGAHHVGASLPHEPLCDSRAVCRLPQEGFMRSLAAVGVLLALASGCASPITFSAEGSSPAVTRPALPVPVRLGVVSDSASDADRYA